MSIHWIRSVLVDGSKKTLDIQLGYKHIGDRNYARIGEKEIWFNYNTQDRNEIVRIGLLILKRLLSGHRVQYSNGKAFNWK